MSIYIADSARGRGVGKRLLGALVDASEHHGIWTLQAGIFPENEASIHLHQQAGFRIIGRRERLGCMNGQWRDIVLMERRSALAFATAAFAFCDLAEMQAQSPAEYGAAVRWAQLSLWAVIVSLAGFVWLYLRAGRLWLLLCVLGLRTAAVLLNFLTGPDLNYRHISSLSHIQFLGESVAVAKGVANPGRTRLLSVRHALRSAQSGPPRSILLPNQAPSLSLFATCCAASWRTSCRSYLS